MVRQLYKVLVLWPWCVFWVSGQEGRRMGFQTVTSALGPGRELVRSLMTESFIIKLYDRQNRCFMCGMRAAINNRKCWLCYIREWHETDFKMLETNLLVHEIQIGVTKRCSVCGCIVRNSTLTFTDKLGPPSWPPPLTPIPMPLPNSFGACALFSQ